MNNTDGEHVTPKICALCEEDRELCQSHIIPEFLYKPGYDEKGRLLEIWSESGQSHVIQKGYREPLLCEDCEGFLNDNYEKPFHRMWYGAEGDRALAPPDDVEGALLTGLDYAPFKLFHLSILWRCSVARGEQFDEMDLGPHEERIHEMVHDGDPGPRTEYAVMAVARTLKEESTHGFVMAPACYSYEATRIYALMYGGFEWMICVGSHCPRSVREIALTEDGRLPVIKRGLEEHEFVRDMMRQHREWKAGREIEG